MWKVQLFEQDKYFKNSINIVYYMQSVNTDNQTVDNMANYISLAGRSSRFAYLVV